MPGDKDFQLDDDLDSFSFEEDNLDMESLDLGSLDETPSLGELSQFDKTEEKEIQEPFGVWVKTGPEEVSTSEEHDSLDEDADALSLDELSNLTDNVELVPVSEIPLEGETLDDDFIIDAPAGPLDEPTKDQGPVDEDSFDDISIDDFVTFEGEEDVVIPNPPTPGDEPSAIPSEEEMNEEYLDIDIDIEDEIGDDELEILEGAKVVRDDVIENEVIEGAQTIDLSEFGDFSLDEDPMAGAGTQPPESQEPTTPEKGFFEEEIISETQNPDFSADFDEVLLEEKDTELDFTQEVDEPDISHISALENDLTSGIKQPPQETQALAGDQAAQILLKIERELSSIKDEISELKKEVTTLKSNPESVTVDSGKEKHSTGFFDEDEDETIALTGDELDNILSSAAVKEEVDSGESFEESLSGLGDEDLILTDSDGNIQEEEPLTTDEDLLAGTSLEADQDEALGIPDVSLQMPMPGSRDMDLNLDQNFDSESTIPETITLEEDTQNLLGGMDDTTAAQSTMDEIEEMVVEPVTDDLTLDLDQSFDSPENMDIETMSSPEIPEEEEPVRLEIPFDTDINLDDEAPAVSFEAPMDAPVFNEEPVNEAPASTDSAPVIPDNLRGEIRSVLTYMDKLLASLPDDKIQEFAESEHFETYKKLFEELGLIE